MIDVINTVILWAIVIVAALAIVMALIYALAGNWYGAFQFTTAAILAVIVALLAYADIKNNGGSIVEQRGKIYVIEEREAAE